MTSSTDTRARLRLWPGVAIAVVLSIVRFGIPIATSGFESFRFALLGGLLGMLAISVWWTFFSRVERRERWIVALLMPAALAVTWAANHPSMGIIWLVYYAAPVLSVAFVAWVSLTRRSTSSRRWNGLTAALLLACGPWTLLRMDGLTGDHVFEFAWRWTETREQVLLNGDVLPSREGPTDWSDDGQGATWPGFRGPDRNGAVSAARIEADWVGRPPTEVWRRPVGPGWSSFAVGAGRVFTQEQRGDEELVICQDAETGEVIWVHRDSTRFFESIGGPGPRATPTLEGRRLYTLGATGILNALDAGSGESLWRRNVATDTGSEIPVWGFASSPLLKADALFIAACGILVSYNAEDGELRWTGPDGGPSYCSPQDMTIAGVDQIVLLSDSGATGFVPDDGRVLWDYAWPGTSLVQPAAVGEADILVNAGEGKGIRRIALSRSPEAWSAEAVWESSRLKPNFNDFVVHEGYAYGFDGSRIACIALDDGRRAWKGGRYGHGQLLLLAEQDLLLVLSEQGEVLLVDALPDRFNERARFQAIEGKTWNHPVLAGDLLLVRNGQEAAAFKLQSGLD